jgi:2-methylcitrate dehydratase
MDSTIRAIADYTLGITYSDLPADVVHDCKRRVLDTLGCGLGAFHAEPCRIARTVAMRANVPDGAYVLGTGHRTLPDLAAFANGIMARYIEGNDVYHGGGGHPSDVIPAVLAVADAAGVDGKAAITATVVTYEVHHRLFKAVDMRDKGLDHTYYTAVTAAVGAAKVLGFDHEQIANAVALAVTPNIPLHATRRGNLSMWKGCAAGNCARNGVFAALLAQQGMTGPDAAFEGSDGLKDIVDGDFHFTPFGADDGPPFFITQVNMKYFRSEGHSQAPITAAIELHSQVRPEDIESVTIYTYWFTWSEIGSEPEKWHPATREAADHSLPYIVSAVLIDGRFSDDIFADERIGDPRIHELINKIKVIEDPDFTRRAPRELPCRMEIVTKTGERKVAEVNYPRGHEKNPMTDGEIDTKFRGLVERVLPKARVDRALELLWRLDEARDLRGIFEAVRIEG